MSIVRKRRSAVRKIVTYERGLNQQLAVAEVDRTQKAHDWANDIRARTHEHAGSWAERMYDHVKKFGDGDPALGNLIISHFVFDSPDPEMRMFHELVHNSFRSLLGIQFKELSDQPNLEAIVGKTELYGWGTYGSTGELRLATYEATRVDIPLDHPGTGVLYQRPPIVL